MRVTTLYFLFCVVIHFSEIMAIQCEMCNNQYRCLIEKMAVFRSARVTANIYSALYQVSEYLMKIQEFITYSFLKLFCNFD